MAVHGSPLSDVGSMAALRSLFDRSSLEHQKVFPNAQPKTFLLNYKTFHFCPLQVSYREKTVCFLFKTTVYRFEDHCCILY